MAGLKLTFQSKCGLFACSVLMTVVCVTIFVWRAHGMQLKNFGPSRPGPGSGPGSKPDLGSDPGSGSKPVRNKERDIRMLTPSTNSTIKIKEGAKFKIQNLLPKLNETTVNRNETQNQTLNNNKSNSNNHSQSENGNRTLSHDFNNRTETIKTTTITTKMPTTTVPISTEVPIASSATTSNTTTTNTTTTTTTIAPPSKPEENYNEIDSQNPENSSGGISNSISSEAGLINKLNAHNKNTVDEGNPYKDTISVFSTSTAIPQFSPSQPLVTTFPMNLSLVTSTLQSYSSMASGFSTESTISSTSSSSNQVDTEAKKDINDNNNDDQNGPVTTTNFQNDVIRKPRLTVFASYNFQGPSETFELSTSKCTTLPEDWHKRVSSIKTHGDCIEVCQFKNCFGRCFPMAPGAPGHNSLRDINFDKRIASMRCCLTYSK